jgi:hypothetical protein
LREPAPVRISLLDDDLAFLDQSLQDAIDVEPIASIVQADADVFEIEKHGKRPFDLTVPRRGFHLVFAQGK